MDTDDSHIALVYNLESSAERGEPGDLVALQETTATANLLFKTIASLGFRVVKIAARSSIDKLAGQLKHLPTENTFIFNYCDGFNSCNSAAVQVAELMEDMGFRHTGATAEVVELTVHKARCKETLIASGVPTPDFQLFENASGPVDLRFPVIVKPVLEDASMGIALDSVANSPEEVYRKVGYILERYEQPAMVEEFISGRELAVSLWGNRNVNVLPISEDDYTLINDPMHHLLTYDAKWNPDSFYYQNISVHCPAALSDTDRFCVEQAAIQAYRAVGLRDFGRVDIRFRDGIPYVIDINELPDLSEDSGFPNSARAAGFSYAQMVNRILEIALQREGLYDFFCNTKRWRRHPIYYQKQLPDVQFH
jgi:D-alanine-D-alanine ligase